MNKKQMTIASLVLATFAVAAGVPVVALVMRWDKTTVDASGNYRTVRPPHNVVRTEVRDERSGEFYRKRTFAGDGKRLIEVEVAYRDGGVGHIYYRDGKPKSEEHRYANGNLKRRAEYDIDGRTMINGETFRPDGTMATQVRKLPDGRRDESEFHTDGKTVLARRTFDTTGSVVLWEYFRTDGTRDKSEAVTADGGKENTTWFEDGKQVKTHKVVDRYGYNVQLDEEFRADGTTVYRTEKLPTGETRTRAYYTTGNLQSERIKESYGKESATFYREDGKTVSSKSVVSWSTAEAWYYRADGTLEQHRKFDYQDMDVEVYGSDGKTLAYRQNWHRDGYYYSGSSGTYELRKVEICDDKGVVVKRQSFSDSGKHLDESVDLDKDGKVIARRAFREDGTLAKEEKPGEKGATETKEHKSEENIRENVDPQHVKQLEYSDPRNR